ncbi:hypothetical protein HORM4_240082 [Vibrio harveyi]|nr:hypothetical protein HORM4_240082 [Vibrio harveyi]
MRSPWELCQHVIAGIHVNVVTDVLLNTKCTAKINTPYSLPSIGNRIHSDFDSMIMCFLKRLA